MSRSIVGAIVLSLLPITAIGQPIIDSLKVIPSVGELLIFGKFASTPGEVRIEGLRLKTVHWSDTEIVCSISDSGKGSAGEVLVADKTGSSEPHYLSLIRCYKGYSHNEDHSRASGNYNSLDVWLRVDLHSAILSSASRLDVPIDTHTVAIVGSYWGTQWDPEYGYETHARSYGVLRARYDSSYSSGFRGTAKINIDARSLRLDVRDIKGVAFERSGSDKSTSSVGSIENYTVDFTLDKDLQPIFIDTVIYMYQGVYQDHITQYGSVSFLPKALVALVDKPVGLTAVDNGSEVRLLWDYDERFDFFEIELSESDTFSNAGNYVSPNGGRPISIERGVKYYWRVRGMNNFGKSKWSQTLSFLMPFMGNVSAEAGSSIRVTPEYIHYSLDETTRKLRIFDLLGRSIDERSLTGTGSLDHTAYPKPCLVSVDGERTVLVTR